MDHVVDRTLLPLYTPASNRVASVVLVRNKPAIFPTSCLGYPSVMPTKYYIPVENIKTIVSKHSDRRVSEVTTLALGFANNG
jgi:hypothetical protein